MEIEGLRVVATCLNVAGMSPKGAPRSHKFTMVMTDEERAMLDELSAADSRSAADWLRLAITRAHGERFPSKTTPKKRK